MTRVLSPFAACLTLVVRRLRPWSAMAGVLLVGAAAQAQVPGNPYSYNRTSSFTYQANGLLKSETVEPDTPSVCVTTTYVYDAYGNKASASTANCAGAAGRAVFASRGSSSTYAAVAAQAITVAGTSVNVAVPAGLFATSAANALGDTETREIDPRFGALIRLVGPNKLATVVQVDDFGRKVKEVRADGTSTVTSYCTLVVSGRDTSANSAGCGTTVALSGQLGEIPADAYSYVQSEQRDTTGVKMGPAARVYSDRAGRKLRELSEAFDGASQPSTRRYVAQDTQYNAQGVAVLGTQPYFLGSDSSTVTGSADRGVTLTTVDALGRTIQVDVADPQGADAFDSNGLDGPSARSTVSYSGLKVTTVNAKRQNRVEEKNADGTVVRITDPYGAQVAHQHDAFGNLVQTKDALQNLIKIAYDIRGRKLSMADPDTGPWQYDYNALGELVWQQSANQLAAGTATTMAYDKLGRLTSRVEPEYTSTWSYDKRSDGSLCMAAVPGATAPGKGKLCETNTSHGINKTFSYDGVGRPVSSRTTVSSGPSFATALTYQAATGRVDTQAFPTGVKVSYAYTALSYVNQLKTATAATLNPLPASVGGTAGASVSLPSGSVLWTAGTVNAWGKAEKQTLGNGVVSRAAYEAATGRVSGLSAGVGSATNVLKQNYTWDSLNNLGGRADANGDGNTGAVSETFLYDSLNRLTQYTVAAPQIPNLARAVTLSYNAIGNILYKSDVGNYDYPAFGNTAGVSNPRPHAVIGVAGTNVGNIAYSYDANGNMTAASGGKYRSVSYNSFNLPDSNAGLAGSGGSPRYTWQYDENHQRVKEVRVNAAGTRTTWSQHPDNQGGLSFESETSPSGGVSNRHYLSVGTQTVVLVSTGALPTLAAGVTVPPTIASITLVKVEYWHKDHLGSLAATTDHAGAVTGRYAYDPFGKRRETNGQYDEFGTLVVDWSSDTNNGTDRGYTGHEQLDDVGIVHMNGRLYDPQIGRFMQADPVIQAMGNLQNYNRFGYCYNNPMGCADPSGYCFLGCFWQPKHWIRFAYDLSGLKFLGVSYTNYKTLASIAAAYLLGPGSTFLEGAFGGNLMAQAATAGFASGTIASGGSLEGALQGAFTAGVFAGVGNVLQDGNFFTGGGAGGPATWGTSSSVAMHGVAGCVTSAVGGGKCGAGALSAAFSKAALMSGSLPSGGIGGVVASSVIGGTASVLGGGKFANGAVTAAFGYLFNELLHQKYGTSNDPRRAMLSSGYGDGGESMYTLGRDAIQRSCLAECVVGAGLAIRGAMQGAAALWSAGLNGGESSVFWAGPNARAVAEGLDGITLGETRVGQLLNFADRFNLVPRAAWVSASTTFANNAQGIATAVINNPTARSIWVQYESGILRARNILVNIVTTGEP